VANTLNVALSGSLKPQKVICDFVCQDTNIHGSCKGPLVGCVSDVQLFCAGSIKSLDCRSLMPAAPAQ
jgi:hypothetical protein